MNHTDDPRRLLEPELAELYLSSDDELSKMSRELPSSSIVGNTILLAHYLARIKPDSKTAKTKKRHRMMTDLFLRLGENGWLPKDEQHGFKSDAWDSIWSGAIRCRDIRTVELLLSNGGLPFNLAYRNWGDTPIGAAISSGWKEASILLSEAMDRTIISGIMGRTGDEDTFFTFLTDYSHFEHCEHFAKDVLNIWRKNGWTPQDREIDTVLRYDTNSLPLLLEQGVSPGWRDGGGRNMLHIFCCSSRGEKEHAQILLDYGVDPNKKDDNGHTPAELAKVWNNRLIAAMLSDKGQASAMQERVTKRQSAVEAFRLLESLGFSVTSPDGEPVTDEADLVRKAAPKNRERPTM